ncbi:hypothetical protein [Micromonospora sp. NBC_01813]|uniref:hypothetical protein n=1 Tax=Micromonospora sp. NBC_01813 TaxID=2975988 RepID=UPI002DD8A45F|nr:hypothetical protein [Micromonospora sp. NBC_01813]WSA07714.1 hypothetical protein OG958_26345 [Micromonospora sp. NBC_01813]
MALPRWLSRRRLPGGAGAPPTRTLYPQWYGNVAVLSHAEDPPALLWQLLREAAAVPGRDALVLVTGRALSHPTGGAALRGAVEHATQALGARRVWVAADGLGRPQDAYANWLLRLATHVGAELLAPDGPIHLTPDGTRYVASGTGASGWRSFRFGADPRVIANRYPLPPWEVALPDRPVGLPGLVADPIPAGVLLRASSVAAVDRSDPAFDVPVDPRGPALVLRHVGEPPVEPVDLAAIFVGLPPRATVRIEVGLLDPAWAPPRPQWLDRLAVALDARRDSGRLAAGPQSVGRRRPAGPPPALLRTGWVRVDDRLYRYAAEPRLLAEVSATGILLRATGEYRRADLAFIDPAEGVLRLDVAASEPLVAALCSAVAMASDGLRVDRGLDHPATARLAALLDGRPDDAPAEGTTGRRYVDQAAFASTRPAAGAPRLTVPLPARVVVPASPQSALPPAVDAASGPSSLPAATATASATAATAATATASAATATAATAATASAATVPGPQPLPAPPAPVAPTAQPSLAHPPVITSSGPDLELPSDDHPDDIPSTVDELPSVAVPLPATSAGEPVLESQPTTGAVDRYTLAAGTAVPDRDSTLAEQREFTAALGPAYTDSITTVNAALAAWPALRQDISAKAKIDLVAVRVYFGRSELGAARLNAGLRAGQQPELSSYLSCLVSGLRRLPPCRRAMICQGRLAVPAQQLYSEGATLVEPGFRSVSGAGLAVEGADVDYLVWSRTARQAGALAERQELDEAVFLAGARFKVLAVREGSPPPAEDVAIPTTAVLLREVLPGEPDTSGLGEADRTVLSRLERALRRRWSVAPQALTDEEAIDRLAGPPLGYVERDTTTAAVPSGAHS